MLRAWNEKRSPFLGFWQVGFEGADHVNGSGHPLCLPMQTGHLRHAREDFARARMMGFKTVRESLGWRETDRNGRFDFSRLQALETHARDHGIQILWTLNHYGLPPGLSWLRDDLVERFAAYCGAVASYLEAHFPQERPRVYTPVNEISFLAWAVCETGLIHPHVGDRHGEGYALKTRLVRASIAASEAIWSVQPGARMLSVDPLVWVAPVRPDDEAAAAAFRERQFQAWDMLAGVIEPVLGGSARHLDLVGINYYPSNQWEAGTRETLDWPDDPRRVALSDLLASIWQRYRRPLVVSETSHVGESKGAWLVDVAREVQQARQAGAPVLGICLYPALNRPDWEIPSQWHDSGLWRVDPASFDRILDLRYAQALQGARETIQSLPQNRKETWTMASSIDTLVVLSHLRWDFVYQRPQHLLSRLARRFRVVFVQEPSRGECSCKTSRPTPGVTVVDITLPNGGEGFSDAVAPAVADMLAEYLQATSPTTYAVWFYTPMALPILHALTPQAIVYDVMDELSGFKNAPTQLIARERTLLRISNAVFTGGPSLFEAKRGSNTSTHCFPSSVDAGHFDKARDPSLADPMYDAIARPRLGFFGVIDERLDIELVAALAAARPEWQICLVGPVVKIDPATLPGAPNLHYFPQQDYGALPGSLAAWDVCLLPFALNEATRFISPTKTLEYMCAGKPVVSTAIRDVEELYSPGVEIAHDHQSFIDACERALNESPAQRNARHARQAALVAQTSWDETAAAMGALVAAAAEVGLTDAAKTHLNSPQVVSMEGKTRSGRSPVDATPCLIIGAGPTGLTAALHCGRNSVLVEACNEVGGWCRSIHDHGFTFDHAGHIMFSKDSYVLALYEKLLGDNLHWQNREAWIYSKQVYTRYPFQGALYGLPASVLKECIVGAVEARFGPLDGSATTQVPAEAPPCGGASHEDCCADGVVSGEGDVKDLSSGTVSSLPDKRQPKNFLEFIRRTWGAGVAKHFAVPYNQKLWTVPLEEMETSWLGGRVPLPNLEEIIEGALRPVSSPVGPNARFGYPLRGGFAALMEGFLPHLDGRLELGCRLTGLDLSAKVATLDDGRQFAYQSLISTMPLPELVRLLGDQAPVTIREAAQALRHVSVKCVNLGIGRPDVSKKHWVYYPEHTVFHRIFLQGNASPHNNPPGGFGLTCEISYSPTKPLPCDGKELIALCIQHCREVGMLREDDPVITSNLVDMPYAYVVYDHARDESVKRIRGWLAGHAVVLAGRYSEWEYYNSDHAFLAGKRAAEVVAKVARTGTV